MNEKPMVALVAVLITFHVGSQIYAWLVGTLLFVTQAIP